MGTTGDEVVALYDDAGRQAGSAPRSQVRAEHLRHGCVAVVVSDGAGHVYVHRRTETKDIYPGCYDVMAGGVIQAGEEPLSCARRETEEELGVTGVEPLPLGEADYADDLADYRAFGYLVIYDGPIRWQPEEVAWGDWVTFDELAGMMADPALEFAPDTRTLLDLWLPAVRMERGGSAT